MSFWIPFILSKGVLDQKENKLFPYLMTGQKNELGNWKVAKVVCNFHLLSVIMINGLAVMRRFQSLLKYINHVSFILMYLPIVCNNCNTLTNAHFDYGPSLFIVHIFDSTFRQVC